MRKIMASGLAAITLGGAVAATAAPAEAQSYYRHRDRDNDAAAAAIIAGVAGLAIGAALAGSNKNRGYYNNGYYYDPRYSSGYGYYNNRYGYAPGYAYAPNYGYGYGTRYRTCTRTVRQWDPYYGRHVNVRQRVPC